MMSTKSEVFDNFIKIAMEKGLLPNQHTEKNTDSPRWDSMSVKDIAKLYHVKPDAPKEMQYEHNIGEVAHPNSLVISPSHDKINGLVENDNERQNILLHIVRKPTDGLATHHKYAQRNLLLALVSLANDLDNRNQDQLRVLADSCLQQLSRQEIKKQAIAPLVIGAVVGVATLIGALYAHQHLPNFDQGIRENYTHLIKEINDLLEADTTLGVGYKYDAALKSDVQGLLTRLQKFMSLYDKVEPIIREIERPKDAQELIELTKKPEGQQAIQAYQALVGMILNMSPYLDAIQSDFESEDYKNRHIVEKGMLSSLVDRMKVFHGGKGALIADDFQDVVNALAPFRDSLTQLAKMLKEADTYAKKAKSDLIASVEKTKSQLGLEQPSSATPETKKPEDIPASLKTKEDTGLQGIDQEAEELDKMMGQLPTF